MPMTRTQRRIILCLLVLILALGAVYYSHRLTKWLAYDDEGGYLYAAWRISLGEMPYRDFLTPQLPAFLYPGALLLKLSDCSVFVARLSMSLLTLGAGLLLFMTVRRLWGDRVALLALILVLVQRDFFWAARFFRPEAPMLFWAMLGIYLFTVGYPKRKRGFLRLAGLAFGLSMMSKLFGALSVAGLALFILVEGVRTRDWRDMVMTGLQVGIPFVLIIFSISGLFMWMAPNFVADVLGHHLRQGSGTPLLQVVGKGLGLYWDFVRGQPVYALLALVGLLAICWRRNHLGRVFVCQVPTALAFLFMTRGLQERHLTYLIPVLAAGAALGLVLIWEGIAAKGSKWPRQALAIALLAVGLAAVAYVQAHTSPDDVVMSDYPGINFFARRATTPLAAGISRGAAKSGQIMGAALIREIEAYDVEMVLLNVAQGAHQFV